MRIRRWPRDARAGRRGGRRVSPARCRQPVDLEKEHAMNRLRTWGLCCAAVVGMTASLTASASAALPEFVGPFPAPFTAKSGLTKLETVKGALITCTSDKGS